MVNLFSRLLALLPGPSTVIVDVVSVQDDGTSIVQAIGAENTYLARGTSVTVGNRAYVKGGMIIGLAPSLPYYEITV